MGACALADLAADTARAARRRGVTSLKARRAARALGRGRCASWSRASEGDQLSSTSMNDDPSTSMNNNLTSGP